MSIKKQIIGELNLKKKLKGELKMTYKEVAKESGVGYTSLLRWIKDENKSMSIDSLERIAEVLGKKFVLIDKNI